MSDDDDDDTVILQGWDLETNEIIEIEISKKALEAMDEAQREARARIEESIRQDKESLRYVRDDD